MGRGREPERGRKKNCTSERKGRAPGRPRQVFRFFFFCARAILQIAALRVGPRHRTSCVAKNAHLNIDPALDSQPRSSTRFGPRRSVPSRGGKEKKTSAPPHRGLSLATAAAAAVARRSQPLSPPPRLVARSHCRRRRGSSMRLHVVTRVGNAVGYFSRLFSRPFPVLSQPPRLERHSPCQMHQPRSVRADAPRAKRPSKKDPLPWWLPLPSAR